MPLIQPCNADPAFQGLRLLKVGRATPKIRSHRVKKGLCATPVAERESQKTRTKLSFRST